MKTIKYVPETDPRNLYALYDLEREVKGLSDMYSDANVAADELRHQLETTETEITELRDEVKDLKSEIEKLREAVENLTDALTSKKNRA